MQNLVKQFTNTPKQCHKPMDTSYACKLIKNIYRKNDVVCK